MGLGRGCGAPRVPWGGDLARLVGCVLVVIGALLASRSAFASAFTPPPLHGHVVDMSGQLAPGDIAQLDQSLEAYRVQSGPAIVALVMASLNGEPIEDVAYSAFNTWQVGDKGLDNGVLIVIATGDRKVRIETGKGVGGSLTDLQANDIIRNDMAPLLQQGRIRDAIDAGARAIEGALSADPRAAPPSQSRSGTAAQKPLSPMTLAMFAGGAVLVVVLLIVSPTFRSIFGFILQILFMFGGRGGGGSSGGGSGYSGGGGRSGGGGSSDSY